MTPFDAGAVSAMLAAAPIGWCLHCQAPITRMSGRWVHTNGFADGCSFPEPQVCEWCAAAVPSPGGRFCRTEHETYHRASETTWRQA